MILLILAIPSDSPEWSGIIELDSETCIAPFHTVPAQVLVLPFF